MGKKRKGGFKKRDGGLSGLKDAVSDEDTGVLGEDGIMGEVDQWEKGEDERILSKVKFKGKRKEEDGPQEMFALSGTDSDSDLELPTLKKMKKKKSIKQKEEVNDSDIESEEDGSQENDLRKWGTKKKHYYGGNTGEEIDEDLNESDLEEDKMEEIEAAKLQSRQLDMMEEEDFLGAFVPKKIEEKKRKTNKTTVDSITKDLSKLSAKEQGKLFRQQNPEFDGVVADFNLRMKEAIKLSKLVSLADAGEIPEGPVLDLVRCKLEILLNYCTNISAYLMFKSQAVSLTLHPITTRLVQFRQLIDKVEAIDKDVSKQIDNLVKQLDAGESIKALVKEEKRRIKRDNERKNKSKIKIADKQKHETKKTKKKSKKSKKSAEQAENIEKEHESEGLTVDEKMALQVYDAVRKNKRKQVDSDEDYLSNPDDNDEKDRADYDNSEKEEESKVGNTYNNEDEDLEDDDIDEKRAITYKIAKNKGLTPKRSKLQRNPRVKNRMKYTKALKRRKGAVREVREQTSKYGGEASGINIRVKKGVKFN